jgi:tRNA A-37 threonylcarbamoyl transferase component Bud32
VIGKVVGRYRIQSQLGQGGMATVYRAHDTLLDRDVAVKFIRAGVVPDHMTEQLLARFRREARSLSRLSHPNIVPIHDFGEYDGELYFVLGYMPGGTLAQKLGRPVRCHEAAQLLAPIARALEYAHSLNIVHRDIKPSNILLSAGGIPVLSDFGIAKLLDDDGTTLLTGTGVGIGTPAYMAPEQGTNKDVDFRADIYSLGIVFYELVTGRLPFMADTPFSVLMKHVNEPLPRPKSLVADLPDEVERVLFKALAKRPSERYQNMGAFADELEALRPSAAPTRTAATARIRPLGAAFLLAGCAAGVFVMSGLVALAALVMAEPPSPTAPPVVTPSSTVGIARSPAPVGDPAGATSLVTEPPSATAEVPTALPTPSETPTPTLLPLPRMFGFSACAQACDGTNASRTFVGGSTRIYATWSYDNIPVGAAYERTWSVAGNRWIRYSCTWPGPTSGVDSVSLREPGQLFSGIWELTITVNGQILLREQIVVEGNVTYWAPAGELATCY